MANLTNTALVAYRDSGGAVHSNVSNTVTVIVSQPGSIVLPVPDLSGLSGTFPTNATIAIPYPSQYSGVSFQWTFIPRSGSGALPLGGNAAGAGVDGTISFRTPSAVASLANFQLNAGSYELDVTAQDTSGHVSGTASKNVRLTAGDLSSIRVYPNPWRSDVHAGKPIAFDGVPIGGTVKIFTVSSHKVKELTANSVTVTWDLTTTSGAKAASGIYVYVISDGNGGHVRGKFAIVR